MKQNKLNKEVEKRFDKLVYRKEFPDDWEYGLSMLGVNKLKQFLANELAKQKKEIIKKLSNGLILYNINHGKAKMKGGWIHFEDTVKFIKQLK